MRARKRFLCGMFALAILFSLSPARTDAASASVYFTAVNEQLLPLSDDTMPFWSDGVLYVASAAFDSTDLGTHYSRSRDRLSAVVYKMRNAITFDLVNGGCETSSGTTYTTGAVLRGDTVFLPVDLVCRFFALDYSCTRITYGYLVRLHSETYTLSDERFINAASSLMAQRYGQYVRAHDEDGKGGADDGSGSASGVQDQPPASERTLYPVFEATDASYSAQILSLFPDGQATFVFSPRALTELGDLLRRLASGEGVIALRVDASGTPEEALRCVEASNRALWNAANVKTRFVHLDGASEETLRAVQEAGYCPLRFALEFGGETLSVNRMSARIFSAADANRGSCRVFFGTDTFAEPTLSALLSNLHAGNCNSVRINEVNAAG